MMFFSFFDHYNPSYYTLQTKCGKWSIWISENFLVENEQANKSGSQRLCKICNSGSNITKTTIMWTILCYIRVCCHKNPHLLWINEQLNVDQRDYAKYAIGGANITNMTHFFIHLSHFPQHVSDTWVLEGVRKWVNFYIRETEQANNSGSQRLCKICHWRASITKTTIILAINCII